MKDSPRISLADPKSALLGARKDIIVRIVSARLLLSSSGIGERKGARNHIIVRMVSARLLPKSALLGARKDIMVRMVSARLLLSSASIGLAVVWVRWYLGKSM